MKREYSLESIEQFPPTPRSLVSALVNKTGDWRFFRPLFVKRSSPCSQACPIGQDLAKAFMYLERGDWLNACETLLEENPFPSIMGRICSHPCQDQCNRRELDEEISIRSLERAIGDMAASMGERPKPKGPRDGRALGVVGSGPAGLSCAYHLARLGHRVTIYEANTDPGGMLRYGIPAYRLPKDLLNREINRLERLGIKIRTGVRVGTDISLEELSELHEALFVAVGAWRNRAIKIRGENLPGVLNGLEFLNRVNQGEDLDQHGTVAVIGGGNTALDVARCLARVGAKPVIIYRRTRDEMPAFDEEVDHAKAEGIRFEFLASPIRLLENGGRVCALELTRMVLGEPDATGRPRPVPIPGSTFILEVEGVVKAIGEDPDLSFVNKEIHEVGEFHYMEHPGHKGPYRIFYGGDAVSARRTAAHAVGSGKRAAMIIDRHLMGLNELELPPMLRIGESGAPSMARYHRFRSNEPVNELPEVVAYEDLNLAYFEKAPRIDARPLDARLALRGFEEIISGLNPDQAMEEVARCFQCGQCNQCDNCFIYCPDLAVKRNLEDLSREILYDYCKGCGICVHECPRAVLDFERETTE